MASILRMMKSGTRLYNYKPRSINLAAASPINRTGAPANLYRSLCSNSSGDRGSILSNIKSSDDVDTYARVTAFRAAGIPLKQAQVLADEHVDTYKRVIALNAAGIPLEKAQDLAKKWKDLPESKFDSLLKSNRFDRSVEIEKGESAILALIALVLGGATVITWCGVGVAMYYNECESRESQKALERKYNNRI